MWTYICGQKLNVVLMHWILDTGVSLVHSPFSSFPLLIYKHMADSLRLSDSTLELRLSHQTEGAEPLLDLLELTAYICFTLSYQESCYYYLLFLNLAPAADRGAHRETLVIAPREVDITCIPGVAFYVST